MFSGRGTVTDRNLDAVIVGAGWAGLSVSHALKALGLRHVVFERHRICETWRTQRWDSFHMNTPNVQTVMPGERYRGDDPEGFMTRDEFVAMVAQYAQRHELPVQTNTAVSSVHPYEAGGFEVVTSRGVTRARNVVIATGNLNIPKRPSAASRLPMAVTQIDGPDYRKSSDLRSGAVLVIGCGNSGGQIAEDLVHSGRKVFLATGRNGRVPRRYRGRDISLWLHQTGRYDRPRTAQTGRPLLGATHTISLQSLSAMGVVMLGRFMDVDSRGALVFADDLRENAKYGDQVSAELRREIDEFIAQQGLKASPAAVDEAEAVAAQFPAPPILSLDLDAHEISTIIWCVGFRGDFSWLRVPGAVDDAGYPLQERCVSVPGIYFAGLDTSYSFKAGTILMADQESGWIAGHIR
jgi:putative flavoprotein involved in K+ transport